jgi:hypothetical protein
VSDQVFTPIQNNRQNYSVDAECRIFK